VFFRDFFSRKWNFLGQREMQKHRTAARKPGIRFAAPKIITKGAKISRKFHKKQYTKMRLNRSASKA
jgi:hypothetical protein